VAIFLYHMAQQAKSDGELALLLELASKTGHPHLTVHMAKIGIARGWAFEKFAYPLDLLPDLKPSLASGVEPALIYAVVAQESEFNSEALSPAGARGLMQLMPRTAAQMASRQNLNFAKHRLTSDPKYNLRLGIAYLHDLLDTFSGSYLLALAAYNAGPTRVDQWIQQFGDPRSPTTDPVDWVERLPFEETRKYVKKILAGLQIFRDKLGLPPKPNGIFHDLRGEGRGRPTANASASR